MTEKDSERSIVEEVESDLPLPLDTVFRVLAHPRRRRILYYLTTCNYAVPLKELIDKVVIQEAEPHKENLPADVYGQIALDLHHTQIPKLAEAGVIEYNKQEKLVALADTIRPLDEYLHLAEQHDQS